MAEGIGDKREVPKEGIGVLCTYFAAWRKKLFFTSFWHSRVVEYESNT